jgi:hypothetical protein
MSAAENDRIRTEFAAALDAGHGTIEVGRTVICDRCDTDLTGDPRSGGFLFAGYAYGPCCAVDGLASIRRYNEENHITAWCPAGLSFADWVRGLRGSNNRITVHPGHPGGGAR